MNHATLTTWDLLIKSWPIIAAVFALAGVGVAVIARRVINQRLYKPDGGLIYTQQADCQKNREACQPELGKKIDGLTNEVKALGEKVAFMAGAFEEFKKKNGG